MCLSAFMSCKDNTYTVCSKANAMIGSTSSNIIPRCQPQISCDIGNTPLVAKIEMNFRSRSSSVAPQLNHFFKPRILAVPTSEYKTFKSASKSIVYIPLDRQLPNQVVTQEILTQTAFSIGSAGHSCLTCNYPAGTQAH